MITKKHGMSIYGFSLAGLSLMSMIACEDMEASGEDLSQPEATVVGTTEHALTNYIVYDQTVERCAGLVNDNKRYIVGGKCSPGCTRKAYYERGISGSGACRLKGWMSEIETDCSMLVEHHTHAFHCRECNWRVEEQCPD